MSKIFVIIMLTFIILNIINGIKLSKTNSKVDELMYTSCTSLYFLICVIGCKLIDKMLSYPLVQIEYLDTIILLSICMMFVIINGFILIAKSNDTNSKRTLISGFCSMIFFPVQMIISLPIMVIIFIYKIKERNDHKIKVYEEEFYNIEISENGTY